MRPFIGRMHSVSAALDRDAGDCDGPHWPPARARRSDRHRHSNPVTARSLVARTRRWRCDALRTRTSCAIPFIFSGAAHRSTPGLASDAIKGSVTKSSAMIKNGAFSMRNGSPSTARFRQVNHRGRTRVREEPTAWNGPSFPVVLSSPIPLREPNRWVI
jgi:hypothetical protein